MGFTDPLRFKLKVSVLVQIQQPIMGAGVGKQKKTGFLFIVYEEKVKIFLGVFYIHVGGKLYKITLV